jgi:hypothetical protein
VLPCFPKRKGFAQNYYSRRTNNSVESNAWKSLRRMTVKDLKSDGSSAFIPSFLHKMHQESMKLPLAVYEDKKKKP